MSGKTLVIGLLVLLVAFGGGLFYAQNYAFYQMVEGRTSITVGDREIAVGGYRGIDATSSGLKRRGCFEVDPAAFEGLEPAADPVPLTAPFWFDCFDAQTLASDLAAGRTVAFMAAVEEVNGIDRLVTVYPDGRGYEWRQLNPRFAK